MKFAELGLSDRVVRALNVLEFEEATPIQAAAIPKLLTGCDLIGRSVTGSGKTFAFGLPMIERIDETDCVQGLVLCPTRELAEQVTGELRKVTNSLDRVKVVLLAGGMDMTRQIKGLKSARIVVGTPGRVIDHLKRRTFKPAGVKTAVLDEADEMLKMGFQEDMETILAAMPSARQTVMFSATMPPEAVRIADGFMRSPQTVDVGGSAVTVDTVRQGFIFCRNADKVSVLIDALKAADTDKCMVFCNTRNTVEQLTDALKAVHINARALHGQMQQSERRRAMSAARSYGGVVLVATDVAARGIDIDDIEYVFNYDVPHESDYYIHRIGRTARAGKTGTAITIVTTRAQQAKLRGYTDAAHCELLSMAVNAGRIVVTERKPDGYDEKISAARDDGDLSLVRALEEERKAGEEACRTADDVVERMLKALQRKKDQSALIEELHTFGYSDEELLGAALTLYLDARGAMRRSHEDRAARWGRSPYKKPSGAKRAPRPPKKGR